jgi:hypothetical protein
MRGGLVRYINRRSAAFVSVVLLVLGSLLAACGDHNASVGASLRIVLEADFSKVPDIDASEALKSAADIIQRRVDAYGATAEVHQEGATRLSVDLAGIGAAQAQELAGRTGLLEFREPKMNEHGDVFICEGGTVIYDPPGCEAGEEIAVPPDIVAAGSTPDDVIWVQKTVSPDGVVPETPVGYIIRVETTVSPDGGLEMHSVWVTVTPSPDSGEPETPTESIIWVPALATGSDGQETALTGRFLKANTYVTSNFVTGQPELRFEMTEEGAPLLEQVTTRLIGLPLAFFLDGQPIRGEDERILAPTVMMSISEEAAINGLSADDARMLSILLNSGALPVPLQVVEVEELGE